MRPTTRADSAMLFRLFFLNPSQGYALGDLLTWDIENRPTSIVSGNVTTTFGYDAKGARVSKSVAGGATTHYVNRYYEFNVTTGEATKHYYLGDRLVAVKKGASAVQYVLPEHLGSTSVAAAGGATNSTKYLPYGTTRSESGTLPTERRFTGQRLDATTGLYYYNARYYDPSLGRFISADSMVPAPGNPQNLNRYSYGRNNPLKYSDPSGHWCVPCVEIGVGVTVMAVGALMNPDIVNAPGPLDATIPQDNASIRGALANAPVIGDANDITGALTGRDVILGETLSPIDRGIYAGSALLPLAGGRVAKQAVHTAVDAAERVYSKHTFRNNVVRLRGDPPSPKAEAHHVLPQELEEQFHQAGIKNIHDPRWGVW